MSHAERLERLRAGLDARGLDGFLVSQPESRFYLSGYAGHDLPPRDSAGYLLVTRDRALLLTDPRTTEQAEAEAPLYEVLTYPAGSRGPETIGQTAQKLGLAQLGFESVHLPYGIWQEISRHQPLVPTYDVVDELRIVKDAEELAELQAAVDVLDRCLAHVLAGLEPGLSERQVARRVEAYLLEHADGPSFPSFVAGGPNASIPHAVPSERVIQAGEGLKIDIGARVAGYCSDMTRTVCLGQPRDAQLTEL